MPYTLNNQPAQLAEEPHDKNGTIYVPFKQLVTALGGSVNWDNDSKQASAKITQWTAETSLGSNSANVNGTIVTFSGPSYVGDTGEFYVPVDFFHNAFGYVVRAQGTDVSISIS